VHSQRRDGPCRIGGARHATLWARPSEWAPRLEVPSGKSFEYRGAAPRRSGRGHEHGTLSHWRNFSRGTGGASGWRCATGWRNCAIQRGTVSRYGRMRRSRRSSIHGHGPSMAQLFSPPRQRRETTLCQALAQLCHSPRRCYAQSAAAAMRGGLCRPGDDRSADMGSLARQSSTARRLGTQALCQGLARPCHSQLPILKPHRVADIGSRWRSFSRRRRVPAG